MSKNYFKMANAPESNPLIFDLDEARLFTDRDAEDEDSVISLDSPHSVAKMSSTLTHSRPKWLQDFFGSMNDYVTQASDKAEIDTNTGELSLSPRMSKSSVRKVCEHLAWLYEAQYRQNKEILLWIGEIILDFMSRSKTDMTIEEAIEDLGLLSRTNGVNWKLNTLAKWPVVIQRIPSAIRQLPIPPTYLSEAALFAQPEDPLDRIKFNNCRDAMLVAVSENQGVWSRARFVNCMKELQDHFNMERTRNEGVAALQARLISYYRIRHEAAISNLLPSKFYGKLGLTSSDVSSWIFNIECELQHRGKMPHLVTDEIFKGDGLTKSARERNIKAKLKAQTA